MATLSICFSEYRVKALTHYNQHCKKFSYRYWPFLHNYNDFFTILYMDTGFHNDTFRKIAVKIIPWEIIVVCEGLYVWATIFITIILKNCHEN